MARPLKESLDYFPLDIDFDQDDKLIVPLAKFGMEGLGVIVKLMGEVYRKGYFYPWTEREHYVFSNRVNVDINRVKEIVNDCIKWGFFNQKVFDAEGVLTSKGFQKRFIEAAKRRKSITIIDDYLLIDPAEECKKVSHDITIVNADGNIVNVYINPDKCNNPSAQIPQSKVKESKVKESKEIEKKELPPESLPPSGDAPSHDPKKGKGSKEKPKYDEDNPYYKMASYFKTKVDEMAKAEGLMHLTAKTNLQTWANDFRLLVEVDKQEDKNLIRKVMDWVVTDSFWKSNVLSASKFRDQFPKLVLEMRRPKQGKKYSGTSEKTKIDVVPSVTDGHHVSDEEMAEMMEFARQMSGKPDA
ncbi:DUF4373 domain-containing protein [Paenibacillus solani]|uniref:DUF4373 domain-containing protein n=1 Tax=Paenibacillus solani TaxID=1705565 RepID=UPI0009E6CD7D|nr:DUF4373 domain-containing protein [Paenibacillus solani]